MSVACVNIEDSFILNYLLWAGSNNKHICIRYSYVFWYNIVEEKNYTIMIK